ncbi:MAG: hypothetical protein ACRCYD_10635 [Plesiomonas sp.]
MNRTTSLIVALIITLATALLILGSFDTTSWAQSMRLAENDFLWMVFFVRLYWGASLFFSRMIAVLTILGTCGLFFTIVAFLLNVRFTPNKLAE